MQVLLQSREAETEALHSDAEALAQVGLSEDETLARLGEDLERLNVEILALYESELPPAVIHQITRGARDQAAIAGMLLDDCVTRANNNTLTPKHIANAANWIGGVRRWIESRRTNYAVNCRRKFYAIKTRR